METTRPPRLRRIALEIVAFFVIFAALLGVASQADASLYEVPNPPLKNRIVNEGGTAAFRTKLTCPFPECTYRLYTAPGTATVDNKKPGNKDYNPFAYQTVTLEKGQAKALVFRVKTLTDDVCEKDEYFFVKLEGEWSGINDRYGGPAPVEKTVKATIRGEQCIVTTKPKDIDVIVSRPELQPKPAPAPDPAPAPAPAPPPGPTPNTTNGDSTSGQQTSWTAGSTTIARCTTDLATGVQGQYDAWGHYIAGCTVRLTCPVSVRVCQASEESRINTEFYIGHRVTLSSRMRVFSASNTEFWHRDQSCANNDWCAVEDMVMVRGGESASVQCNGVRQSGPEANRARNTCQLSLESLY
jgi:hypothetical protein